MPGVDRRGPLACPTSGLLFARLPAGKPPGLAGPLGPDPGEVDDRGRSGPHIGDANPFATRMVVMAAGREVRAGQPALGEDRAVGAATETLSRRLHAGPAYRL